MIPSLRQEEGDFFRDIQMAGKDILALFVFKHDSTDRQFDVFLVASSCGHEIMGAGIKWNT